MIAEYLKKNDVRQLNTSERGLSKFDDVEKYLRDTARKIIKKNLKDGGGWKEFKKELSLSRKNRINCE